MSTIIRIKGADFNNSNLPVIPRLVSGQLKFSYKPSIDNGFVDSSGAGDVPTKIGSPTLLSNGLLCGTDDGYRSQSLDTVDEITAICILTDGDGADTMPIGCYDADNTTGWGIFFRSGTVRAAAYNSSGGNSLIISDNNFDTSAQWVAMRITNTEMTLFTAENGSLVKKSVTETYEARSKDETDNIGIGSAPLSSWPSIQDIVSEATFYQRALTDSEIQKAYEYSAAYFNNHTEVSI